MGLEQSHKTVAGGEHVNWGLLICTCIIPTYVHTGKFHFYFLHNSYDYLRMKMKRDVFYETKQNN
jgi:hypothetical protein